MRNFILVISVALITVNAYAWGTSQTAVQPEQEIKKVEKFKGVPEAERVGKPSQPTTVIKEPVKQNNKWGNVDGTWQHFTNGTYTNIGQAINKDGGIATERLAIGYGQNVPTIAVIKIIESKWFELNIATLIKFNREFDIVLNGQRLIAKGELEEKNMCDTQQCVQEVRSGKRLATYVYKLTIVNDDANEYAYRVFKSNDQIDLKVASNHWTVDMRGFNAADAKHSVAF